MTFAKTIPAIILHTILTRLGTLFLTGAGGDPSAAQEAAAQMLAAYRLETAEDLRLAAHVISFSLHGLEALGQASAPNITLSGTLRLRASAVSLNRASEKTQRRLDEVQQARPEAVPAQADHVISAPSEAARTSASSRPSNQVHCQLQDPDVRIAASLKRAEARIAAYNSTASVGLRADTV
jgi:hypothetical protein